MSDPANTGASPAPSGGGLADLGLRAASAIVMVALALGSLWAGGAWFTLFWALAGFAVYWEWQHLAGGRNMAARIVIGAFALAGSAALASTGSVDWAVALLLIGALAIAISWCCVGFVVAPPSASAEVAPTAKLAAPPRPSAVR